jgi:Outer membrane protein beta-barrel domain
MQHTIKKLLLLGLIPFLTYAQETAKPEIINPKGNWYFGAEMGLNTITSFDLGEPNKSFQGGVLAEYYTGRHWSLSGRIKYFETGVSFYRPNTHTGGWFDLGHDSSLGTFSGAVIAIPLDIKWEFRMHENFRGYLKTGLVYNYETQSNYNFSENVSTNHAKDFGSFNTGIGFSYFLNKKMAVYVDLESYSFGGQKASYQNLVLWDTVYYTENSHLNFGIKYNFKK